MTSTLTRRPAPSVLAAGPAIAGTPPDGARLRRSLRATARYLLRAQAASTDASGGDITAALIMVGVMSANVRHLDRAGAPRRFVDYDDPPPDDLRAPVTAIAVADRLGLPRETVRRRLDQLVKAGRCQRRRGGFFVPQAVISNQEHLQTARANFAAIGRLRKDLADGPGEGWPRASPPSAGPPAPPPLRLVNRHVTEFSLDVLAPLAQLAGGYDEVFVYLAAVEATGRCVPGEEPPLVSARALAESLGLPDESARRRLKKLATMGLLQQGGKGYWAEPVAERASDVRRIALINHQALQRLFEALSADGVDLTARHP